jgi:hypothetical protein
MELDIGGHVQKKAFFYVVDHIESYEMILGKGWLRMERVLLDAAKGCLSFQKSGMNVYSEPEKNPYDHKGVSAAVFNFLAARKRKLQVFTASLADINKALAEKEFTDPQTKLLL